MSFLPIINAKVSIPILLGLLKIPFKSIDIIGDLLSLPVSHRIVIPLFNWNEPSSSKRPANVVVPSNVLYAVSSSSLDTIAMFLFVLSFVYMFLNAREKL